MGSEMCIRDRTPLARGRVAKRCVEEQVFEPGGLEGMGEFVGVQVVGKETLDGAEAVKQRLFEAVGHFELGVHGRQIGSETGHGGKFSASVTPAFGAPRRPCRGCPLAPAERTAVGVGREFPVECRSWGIPRSGNCLYTRVLHCGRLARLTQTGFDSSRWSAHADREGAKR